MSNKNEKKKNRNFYDITADILGVAKEGSRKTRIMYLANLSFDLLKKYLEYLQEKNLLEYDSLTKLYKTTDKGKEFLKEYTECKEKRGDYLRKKKAIESMLV